MKTENTSIRLKKIMRDRNLRPVDILKLCEPFCKKYGIKMGRNDLSQYISGKNEPGQWKLTVLAEALDTNEVWLMGYDVQFEPYNKSDLSDTEKKNMISFLESENKNLEESDNGKIVTTLKTDDGIEMVVRSSKPLTDSNILDISKVMIEEIRKRKDSKK